MSLFPYRIRLACSLAVVLSFGLANPNAQAQDPANPLPDWITQYSADMDTLDRRYQLPVDEEAIQLRKDTHEQWLATLQAQSFESLPRTGQADYVLLRGEIEYRLKKEYIENQKDREAVKTLPYWDELFEFCKTREDIESIDPRKLATQVAETASVVESAIEDTEAFASESGPDPSELVQQKLVALRATELLRQIQRSVEEADRFYRGYDPLYTWWLEKPMARLIGAVKSHRQKIREIQVGVSDSDKETIIGIPIGAEGLAIELEHEWIAHSPSELVELAHREMKWCEEEMAKASQELGFGDDWRAAMEHTKSKHVEPGEQPKMIRDLAWEAIRFLEAHDLVTVPPLAANGWRMTMMSPDRQRLNPYFLGGQSIIVSFPTNTMTHDEKLMSMRSNNEHFSRATVHHELIPGHHLQYYMLPRNKPYRSLFRTPFWMEGWALYWEMLLWDLDFAQSAEDRVGMLFWRKHRCARIIFSLSYHLGEMTPDECIDYLVERVGHEPSAAAAEVRRSIMGGYSPLYQAAYMLGGLQIRAMHKELVQSGRMANREFHDQILTQHSIPIEILRNSMSDHQFSKDDRPSWKFAD